MSAGTLNDEAIQNHSLIDQLNAFNDGIFISDQKGNCLFTNDALCSMLGYDYSGALFDLNFLDYVAPEFREEFRDSLGQTGKIIPETGSISILPLRKRNGQMILAEINSSFNMIDNRVISITAIVRDLSAREASPALKEKITTYYPGLLKNLPGGQKNGKLIKDNLISNTGLNKHEFEVNAVLQQIKSSVDKEIHSQNNHNLILSLTIPDPDPTRSISTDQEVFVQIIRNLLNHLIRISGTEQIEFGYHIEKGIYPLFFARSFSGDISQDKLNRSYETLEELSNFSSLLNPREIQDLVHTQKLVELLSGSIWAKSGMPENLVFYFHVGKEQIISHATIHSKESPDWEIEWASKNILVVEDLPNNYLYIEAILRKTRANLIHVTNGMDAINKVMSGQQVDLILMDIRLPGMDGYETTRKIKLLQPNIPVIAVTAYSFQDEEEKIRKAGINGYIGKPIHSDDLISKMNEVMRNSPHKRFRLKKWTI